MMDYAIVFSPEAEEQLADLYRYIAEHATPITAERYTSAIVNYCEEMRIFPHRGTQRDDILPGLRITNYRGHAIVAFAIDDVSKRVAILGVYYGGQDFESALKASTK